MSVASPAARSLLRSSLAANTARASAAASSAPGVCHNFHSSAQLAARRKSRFKNVLAEKMGLIQSPQKMEKYNKKYFPEYTAEDEEILSQKYTEEQLVALKLGEAVVDPTDLTIQGRIRKDPYKLRYLEDFSKVRPVIDKRVKTGKPVDPTARFMMPDEFNDDFVKWATEMGGDAELEDEDLRMIYTEIRTRMLNKKQGEKLELDEMNAIIDEVLDRKRGQEKGERKGEKGEETSDLEVYKYLMERNSMTGYDGGDTALAPALPEKVPGVEGLYKSQEDPADAGLDPEGNYQDLKKQTGMSLKDLLKLERSAKVLVTRWVSNQTRLGKIRSTYILAIAGNGDGRLGMGEAKSVDAQTAVQKAKRMAIRNMKPIRRYENRTIFGNVEAKVGATIVQISARPPGFGLRVSHRIFEMARASGIYDLAAKMPRSRNPMNSVKATYQALTNQPDPEQIAIGRGKKLVDARKVYFGGATL